MSTVDPTLIDPVTINILIVADGRLRFDDQDFSLKAMIEALHKGDGPIMRFTTTTAYRKAKEPIRPLPGDETPDSDGPEASIADRAVSSNTVACPQQ